jgi:hypothetical protein
MRSVRIMATGVLGLLMGSVLLMDARVPCAATEQNTLTEAQIDKMES